MKNKIHDAFEHIQADEHQKSSLKAFLRAEREKETYPLKKPAWRIHLAASCSAVILLLMIGGYSAFYTPVSYISIDVNPSVELSLNSFYRVIRATAYNEDGGAVLDGISVKDKRYTDAIDLIVGSEAMRPYLTDTPDLTFTVAAADEKQKTELLSGIESTRSYREHDGRSAMADEETISEAHDHGLSFGKYSAYLVLSEYDDSITVNDCHHMSMSEIHCLIEEHESGVHSKEEEGTCKEEEEACSEEHEHHHE